MGMAVLYIFLEGWIRLKNQAVGHTTRIDQRYRRGSGEEKNWYSTELELGKLIGGPKRLAWN